MFTNTHKVQFLAASPKEVFEQSKAFFSKQTLSKARGKTDVLLDETPDRSLHWISRLGLARFDCKAYFIPAQGGCVLYLALQAMDSPSRRLLPFIPSLLEGQASRALEKFRSLAKV